MHGLFEKTLRWVNLCLPENARSLLACFVLFLTSLSLIGARLVWKDAEDRPSPEGKV